MRCLFCLPIFLSSYPFPLKLGISLLLASGASIKEVQEWAGHSSASTTANIYGHTIGEYKTKLTESINNSLYDHEAT